jgi:hypothetical protein
MSKSPIHDQLEASEREVVDLRAQAADIMSRLRIAEARLDAFQIAAKAFEAVSNPPITPRAKTGAGSKQTRNRLPTEDWQKVFQTLYVGWNNDFGYDEVMQAAAVCGLEGVKRPSLRTKMMNYADGGYVERKDAGRFAITPKGIPYFQIEAQASKENEAVANSLTASDARTLGISLPYDL